MLACACSFRRALYVGFDTCSSLQRKGEGLEVCGGCCSDVSRWI